MAFQSEGQRDILMSYNMASANAYISKLEAQVKELMKENDRLKLGVYCQDLNLKITTMENMAKTAAYLHRQKLEAAQKTFEAVLHSKQAMIACLQKEIHDLRKNYQQASGSHGSNGAAFSSGLFGKKVNNPQNEVITVNMTLKQLQKIMLAQHPDRITHTQDPQLIASANELFHTLNSQYQEFKK